MSTLGPEKMAELGAFDGVLAANMKRQGRTLFDATSEPSHPANFALDGV